MLLLDCHFEHLRILLGGGRVLRTANGAENGPRKEEFC
jgi:hypothetical protein